MLTTMIVLSIVAFASLIGLASYSIYCQVKYNTDSI